MSTNRQSHDQYSALQHIEFLLFLQSQQQQVTELKNICILFTLGQTISYY